MRALIDTCIVIDALQSRQPFSSAAEDAIMVESSAREGMDCIVTRNLRDYTKSSILVYMPDDFLALLTPTEESSSRTDL